MYVCKRERERTKRSKGNTHTHIHTKTYTHIHTDGALACATAACARRVGDLCVCVSKGSLGEEEVRRVCVCVRVCEREFCQCEDEGRMGVV